MRTMVGILLVAGGCSGEGSEDNTKDATDTPTIETGTPIDTDDTQTTTLDLSASLAGSLVDPAGAPVAAAQILFCRGVLCRTGDTDASGTFSFDEVEVAWHSLEIRPPNSDQAYVFAPVRFDTDQARAIDLIMPDIDPATPLQATATEIEMGAGLFVTVGSADLEPPLLVDPATEVAGVLLDPAWWVPTDDVAGTVLAQWSVKPFDHVAPNGLPIRIENTFGLADGTTTRVWVGSYADSAWLDAGTLTAAGGWLEGDARLPLTSTVLLVQE